MAAVVPAAATAGLWAHGLVNRTAAVPARPTYFHDVRPILQGRCAGCHRVGGIAPFPLNTYRNAHAFRSLVRRAVVSREMPPWGAKRIKLRYRFDPSLTAAQISTISRWAKQGGRRGNPAHRARPLPAVGAARIRPDVSAKVTPAYTPHISKLEGSDDHHCFVLPWQPQKPQFVTGFNAIPGQPSEVHHLTVFAVQASPAMIAKWDAEDPGPGYRCIGGASGLNGPSALTEYVGGWAPGSPGGEEYPGGTGLLLLPGMRLVLQIHYNIAATKSRPDRTTVQLQLADGVNEPGGVVPISNPKWPKGRAYFRIPPGRADVTYSYTADLTPYYQQLEPGTMRAQMVALHMHYLGTRGRVILSSPGGRRTVLLDIPHYRFNWQRAYWFRHPVPIHAGDTVTVVCHYDNRQSHQPFVNGGIQRAHEVVWGERSSNEMCVGGLYVFGKVRPTSGRP